MNHHVKSKSQTPMSNRMKREDFLKILDNRKTEFRTQRLLKMNEIQEKTQGQEETQKKDTLSENTLVQQIKQLGKTNAVILSIFREENNFELEC